MMRKLLLIACFIVIAGACKKESKVATHINTKLDASLFTKWELRNQSGGLQPAVNYPAGNGNIVQFNQDSTYTFYAGATISQHGVFHIIEKTSMTEPDKFKYIYYDHETAEYPLVIRHDTLIIGNNAADALESLYIKKQ